MNESERLHLILPLPAMSERPAWLAFPTYEDKMLFVLQTCSTKNGLL